MNPKLLCLTTLALAIALPLAACQSPTRPTATPSPTTPSRPLPTAGHLMIVGGALDDQNSAVYSKFLQLAGPGPILIIPAASGEWAKAGDSAITRFRAHTQAPIQITALPISQSDFALASDPAIIAAIDSATALWFTGGDQSRITSLFRPSGQTSPALAAMDRLLARGGIIGGTSAGAAMMSDPMIAGGRESSPATNTNPDPENPNLKDQAPKGVRIAQGLGFFPYGLVDQHFLQRNRMARLIEAMNTTQSPIGFGVNENAAMLVDLKARRITALGDLGVVIVQPQATHTKATILSTSQTFDLSALKP